MKLKKDAGLQLRTPKILWRFRDAIKMAQRFGFHVIHYSLQGNHIHMIVEAKNNHALAAGMKSLVCRFVKSLRGVDGPSANWHNGNGIGIGNRNGNAKGNERRKSEGGIL